jgi:hypothetical protein
MKVPPPFSWLWDGWMMFSKALGFVMSKIMLTIFWLIFFGIYALIIRLIGLFSHKPKTDSYWLDTPTDYENSMKYQF